MGHLRRVGWAGLALFAGVGAVGLVLAVGSAVAAADWFLARMPWIGAGMVLIAVGLAGAACFGLLLDLVEPIGRWRLLAVPPALLVGAFWGFMLFFGLPSTMATEFYIPTILYSVPDAMAVLIAATGALALPAVVGHLVARRSSAASGA